ncbi:ADP-ribosylglycohydrolase family protein [Lojkania enalia]|uniref:ADP-ribosylhydrolase ARH3 n=1 Tax=Lojkania enalia TaxID=147567 RepID=A0A9P4JWB6_9PLEO|nr:ADP-ribosylglycohydrolase family protein [Didymosphaeria enalia]
MPTSNLRLSKTLGALLGVHAGDSLGATLEFMSWNTIKSEHPHGIRDIVGGGVFSWPAGHATDDTDLTRAVLLAYRDFEELQHKVDTLAESALDIAKAAAEHSLDWLDGEWPGRKKGSRPADIGNATRSGLKNYRALRDPRRSGAGVRSAGNGSLMRCIPTGLFTGTKERRWKESVAISAFTHDDARCTVSCAVYNEIIAELVKGRSAEEAVEIGRGVARDADCPAVQKAIEKGESLAIARLASEGPGSKLPDKTSGYVLQSLALAIAALLDARSFEDVLVDVVRIGGDTDTNGAIAGGLLGARDGIEAIPERWLEKLQFRREFEGIATRILELHETAKN